MHQTTKTKPLFCFTNATFINNNNIHYVISRVNIEIKNTPPIFYQNRGCVLLLLIYNSNYNRIAHFHHIFCYFIQL